MIFFGNFHVKPQLLWVRRRRSFLRFWWDSLTMNSKNSRMNFTYCTKTSLNTGKSGNSKRVRLIFQQCFLSPFGVGSAWVGAMLNMTVKCKKILLGAVIAIFCVQCSGFAPNVTHGTSTLVVDGQASADLNLVDDGDNDGVFAPCDVNDTDVTVTSLLPECDHDSDGYVDTPCTTYLDANGTFSAATKLAVGVNCDLCPESSAAQVDANLDGVGDTCAPSIGDPNIGINADAPANVDSDGPGVDPATLSSDADSSILPH